MAFGGAHSNSGPILVVRSATRRFGPVVALENASLSVDRREFVTLLGPSGSGKTTLLRIIAGLDEPSSIVELSIGGADMRGIPANHRNVATVFQHYGLFPHMSVGKNIEFGLLVRGRPADERRRRAREALELVRLPDMFDRRIHQLSGGERQRVALARALVTEPEILLLDEPLGALDERLRREMQVELLRLQQKLGTTFILVTHSQEEALTMSSRVVLMNHGRIVQDGRPQELFEQPRSKFVANFMGIENVLVGRVASIEARTVNLVVNDRQFTGQLLTGFTPAPQEPVFIATRAERVDIGNGSSSSRGLNSIAFTSSLSVYKGTHYDIELSTPLGTLVSRQPKPLQAQEGGVALWSSDDCVVGPIDREIDLKGCRPQGRNE